MAISATSIPGGMRVGNGRWGVSFDARITLGNIIIFAGMLLASVVWYAKVDAHVNDTQIHQTIEQKQRMAREQFELMIAPTTQRLNDIAENQRRILDTLREMQREARARR